MYRYLYSPAKQLVPENNNEHKYCTVVWLLTASAENAVRKTFKDKNKGIKTEESINEPETEC